ncbi:uncharacterized protein LOC135387717 [Ornithodoros turicata]|uniref:uncharacterized protein LOC135387717 n=1 Tax=Ornithodoros turicata TaxID=34597 RepID=UPI0031399529
MLFVTMHVTPTDISYAGKNVLAYENLVHEMASSRAKFGIDFHHGSLTESLQNLQQLPRTGLDAFLKLGFTATGVLGAEIGPVWDTNNEASVSILKMTQNLIRATEGPIIGVATKEGSDGKDSGVHNNLARLLRAIQASYVIFRSSMIRTDSRSCIVRSPSPWLGAAPSFEAALELRQHMPPDIRARQLLSVSPVVVEYKLWKLTDPVGSSCRTTTLRSYNQWCKLKRLQYIGYDVFHHKWGSLDMLSADNLGSLQKKDFWKPPTASCSTHGQSGDG